MKIPFNIILIIINTQMLPCVASQKKKVQDRVHCLCLALLYVQYVAICLWGTVLQPIPSFLLYFIFYFDTHLCVCFCGFA